MSPEIHGMLIHHSSPDMTPSVEFLEKNHAVEIMYILVVHSGKSEVKE